jgi:hypothetical protein
MESDADGPLAVADGDGCVGDNAERVTDAENEIDADAVALTRTHTQLTVGLNDWETDTSRERELDEEASGDALCPVGDGSDVESEPSEGDGWETDSERVWEKDSVVEPAVAVTRKLIVGLGVTFGVFVRGTGGTDGVKVARRRTATAR